MKTKEYVKPTAFQEYKSDIKLFAGYFPHLFVRLANFTLDSKDEINKTISHEKFFKRLQYKSIFFVGAFFIITSAFDQVKLVAGEVIAEYPHTREYVLNKVLSKTEIVVEVPEIHIPKIEEVAEIVEEELKVAEFSAYTSREEETDSNPFTMASGKRVYEGAIACPTKYSFGTKVKANGSIYICEDRMAKRFREGNYFDIWFNNYDDAISFGRRDLEYKILD